MSLINWSLLKAKKYYDEETYQHAMRVAGYVAQMEIIPEENKDLCIAVAIVHDLIEDTEMSIDDLPALNSYESHWFRKAVAILTKDRSTPYVDYCKKIKEESSSLEGKIAYYVKLADMKDHLSQKETLTDRLKEKYLLGLAELL